MYLYPLCPSVFVPLALPLLFVVDVRGGLLGVGNVAREDEIDVFEQVGNIESQRTRKWFGLERQSKIRKPYIVILSSYPPEYKLEV